MRPPFPDPEVRPHPRRSLRVLYVVLGLVFTVVGILGVALPLLPGTPFLIVALFLYARSSERLHRTLLENRWAGPTLQAWKRHRSIPRRVKPRAMLMVGLAFGTSALFALEHPWARIGWVALGLGVLLLLARLPSHDEGAPPLPLPRAPGGNR